MNLKVIALTFSGRFRLVQLELNKELINSGRIRDRRIMALPDGRIKMRTFMRIQGKRAALGIGLSSPVVYLDQFMRHLQRSGLVLRRSSILDIGAYLGDAVALFSNYFQSVTGVERDPKAFLESKYRIDAFSERGLARPLVITLVNRDYRFKPISFSDYGLVYNYFDHSDEKEQYLDHISWKFKREAKPGALLIILNCSRCRDFVTDLHYREDLSWEFKLGRFNVFQKSTNVVRTLGSLPHALALYPK